MTTSWKSLMWVVIGAALWGSSGINAIAITKKVDRVQNVTIYGSSMISEVIRGVVIDDLLPAGIHTITLTGLSRALDDRSVEISGVGKAEILDVKLSLTTAPVEKDEKYMKILNALVAQRDDLAFQSETVAKQIEVVTTKNKSLHLYIDAVLNASLVTMKSSQDLVTFLGFQDEQLKKLNDDLLAYSKQQKKVLASIKDIDETIKKLRALGECDSDLLCLLT
jgi:hypothetical protein